MVNEVQKVFEKWTLQIGVAYTDEEIQKQAFEKVSRNLRLKNLKAIEIDKRNSLEEVKRYS